MTLVSNNELHSDTKDSAAELRSPQLAHRLNWLRAAVLGANDGIVSIAGLVVGVAAATNSISTIFTAGLAGLVAGGVSMALGEYVSVSAQRDTERLIVSKERHLGIHETSNPWQAALSSAISFTLGAVLPLVAILLPPAALRVPVVFIAVVLALALTGTISAALGGVSKWRAVLRVVVGGAVAMLVTYGIGQLAGTPM
jgi:VIT1/CCC1 family predicted Fe2+/Mn2+ transporter